jgi:hypothetical protein
MSYNPCEQCPNEYPKCKECHYYELQHLYYAVKRDLKKHAQCETCTHTDCANRELWGGLGQNCSDWKYKGDLR